MSGRRAHLSNAAFPLAGFVVTALTVPADAHRLEADFRVLPGNRVQVEGWFDSTGEPPRGAKVHVWRADGSLLTEGHLDGQGTFVFTAPDLERLTVLVSAPGGHAKKLTIANEDLDRASGGPAPKPFADRSPRVTNAEVVSGVALVLAVAAFVLSIRNGRRLRGLERSR